ncbi:MAG: RNA polymerase sigma factor [Pirellulaceae bacterium]|jgi:RNA polymerase sigma-70 factor (ECF subfamily)|nr:RNA polymerase sigma factor [Pirellulaceae bacterium]MDP7017766.1 RNA polymerase sigma factor [Pirellulaceae bacterium]
MPHLDVNSVIRDNLARIYRAALVMTGNPWDADDLTQETLLTFARAPDNFAGRSHVYTWLYGILINLERRERRRAGIRRRKLQVLRQNHEETVEPSASAPLEVREWQGSLWERVADLPDGQRQALVLRFSENLQYDEIADAMDIPLGTAKSRVHHGLRALRKNMQGSDHAAFSPPKYSLKDVRHALESP